MDYERFGPFRVYECLGVGGMATVHRATIDIGENVHRDVALKRLLPQYCDDKEFVADFVREAKLAARLQHPNIVQILELGRVARIHYIAMGLVRGAPLWTILRAALAQQKPAPVGVVVAIAMQVCDALDYAMNGVGESGKPHHVVHRDISPSNLIISDDGIVKIIDFGVAKALTGTFSTSSGLVKGKVSYMSVEALAGKALDARSDLYSLGVTAWELLANRKLFTGLTDEDVIANVRRGSSVPPSRFNRHCPRSVDDIVMGALALSRDARWASAREMRVAFEDVATQFACTPALVAAWKESVVRPVDLDAPVEEKTRRRPTAVEDLEISVVRTPDSVLRRPSAADIALADSLGLADNLGLGTTQPHLEEPQLPLDTLMDAVVPEREPFDIEPHKTEPLESVYEEIIISFLRPGSELDVNSIDDGPAS